MTKTMAKIFSFGLLVLGLMMVDIKGPTFETKTYDSYTVSSMNWESWSIGVNQADASFWTDPIGCTKRSLKKAGKAIDKAWVETRDAGVDGAGYVYAASKESVR